MSILIKGMEMPKSCGECKAFVCYKQWAGDRGDCFCGITKSDCEAGAQNADCPLVTVPKHGDLIDADKLVELCDIMADKCDGIGASIWHQFKTTVEWSPIVIPAEEGE